jgi:hypothetical protein
MRILALDLASRVGWAVGDAGSKPEVGAFVLREGDERIEDAIPRLGSWLVRDGRTTVGMAIGPRQVYASDALPVPMLLGVDLVVAEDYLPLGGLGGFTSPASQETAVLLNGAVRMACGMWGVGGVPIRCPHPDKVRVHFCGQRSAAPRRPTGYKRTSREQREDREATKNMVIARAQMLGYIPRDCHDDDMADACALFDFASSFWGRKSARFELTETR